MADVKQTMISVKKSDGTTVKMSLPDFKKYQAELAQKKNVASQAVVTPANNLPVKIQNESVATSTPVVKAFVNEAEATVKSAEKVPEISKDALKPVSMVAPKPESKPVSTIAPPKPLAPSIAQRPLVRLPVKPMENKLRPWSKEDSSSPLTEKPSGENNKKNVEVVPQEDSRMRAESVVTAVNLSIPDGVRPRMVNLVSSVIGGARDRNMAIEYATRPIANGGLGLSEEQVSALMNKISAEMPKDVKPRVETHVLPENLRQKTSASPQPVLPKKFESAVTPVQKLDQMMRSEAVRSAPISVMRPQVPVSRPADSVKITDIKPPVESKDRLTMGPVDEFAGMTLRDWRRMAVNTEGSLNLMHSKFVSLGNESYTLFLAGRDGWRTSPLFHLYLETIKQALNERRPIGEILAVAGENVLTEAEFRALVELNDYISN